MKGSTVEYPVARQGKIGDKTYTLKLTGAAMRKKAIFNVYTIGSYVVNDFAGRSPEALAAADTMKQLHMVMMRGVDGSDMARAFHEGIKLNHPNEFAEQIKKLSDVLESHRTEKGDEVWITHVPGYGIYIDMVGRKQEFIAGVKFGNAIWEIYLGQKNLGDAIKKGLTSRL